LSGLTKLAIDVTSDDGGTTWKAIKISPVYAFRDIWGLDSGSGTSVTQDNQPQISRTEDGSHIFYSWVDSDTSDIFVGFGESINLMPNLRIAGLRVADGYQTCPKWITRGDAFWDGLAMFPTMAPTVLTDSGTSADYKLPIVMANMLTNNCMEPTALWYFGNDATFLETDFYDPNVLDLDSCMYAGVGLVENEIEDLNIFPNPTNGTTTIKLKKFAGQELNLVITNTVGEVVRQEAVINSNGNIVLDLSNLAKGVYMLDVTTPDNSRLATRLVKM
jgi:hypothetical protein